MSQRSTAQHYHTDTPFCTIRKSHVTWPHSEEIRRCILLFLCTLAISDPWCARSKGMFMTCGARAPSNQLAGWGAARHHCGAGHESRINPNNLRQVRGSIFSLLLVWFAGDMKSERPSKDDEQHCRCVVWEEKTVLQSVAFSAPSRKSSSLRVLLSCEGGRRLALLQGDSRVGRARIRKILAVTEWELSSPTGLARYWMPNR